MPTLIHVFTFTLLVTLTLSTSPEYSPSPSPSPAAPRPQSGSDEPIPSPSPSFISRPPADLAPSPSPSPSPIETTDVSDVVTNEEPKEKSSHGMSGGKKAGVAFGLIAAACFVGFGGMVYRKRQENIRRAQYSSAARLEFF